MKQLLIPVAVIASMMIVSSCQKTPAQQSDQTSLSGQLITAPSFTSLQQLTSNPYRKLKTDNTGYEPIEENCHPEDIVITAAQQSNLDAAIASNSIYEIFERESKALRYISDWNSSWFADVKAAILSGNHTFLKTGTSTYLLGKVGLVSTNDFDYVLQYTIH